MSIFFQGPQRRRPFKVQVPLRGRPPAAGAVRKSNNRKIITTLQLAHAKI